MFTHTIGEQVRWQDLRVMSEVDIVLELAKKEGWEDCEVFGYGDMITQPQESMGWRLIPADLYKHSIPPQAVGRLHQVLHAGVRVQGVIIADDDRKASTTPAPAKARVTLSAVRAFGAGIAKALSRFIRSLRSGVSLIGKALLGFIRSVGTGVSLAGRAFLGLVRVAGVFALVLLFAYALIHYWSVILSVGLAVVIIGIGSAVAFDPKLIILVDDGRGGTVWVSLFTWYD